MPILAATDIHTDIGRIAEEDGYGFYCESRRVEDFTNILEKYISMSYDELNLMGEKGYQFLKENYSVEKSYEMIIAKLKKNEK